MKARMHTIAQRVLTLGLAAAFALLLALYSHAVALANPGSYEVTYEGSARELVSTGSDFFAHFETLMPGDATHGSVQVKNNGQSTQYLSFRADPARSSAKGAADLLEKMQLSVCCGKETLYEGPLLGTDLASAVELGAFAPGNQAQLDFAVTCPADLGNEYALSGGYVCWVFTATAEPAAAPVPQQDPLANGVYLAKTGASTLGVLLLAGALLIAAALSLSNVGRPAGKRQSLRSRGPAARSSKQSRRGTLRSRGASRALRSRDNAGSHAGLNAPRSAASRAAALLHDRGGFTATTALFALMAVAVICLGGVATGSALAYLSATADKTVNPASVGENTIQIVEDFPAGPQPRPGESFTKKVQVKNTGNSPCYVRVLASFSSGNVADHAKLDYDRQNWTRGADGYDYYNQPLQPGKTTPALFTTVTVLEGAETTAGGFVNFDLSIKAESTYAHPDLTPEKAFAALTQP